MTSARAGIALLAFAGLVADAWAQEAPQAPGPPNANAVRELCVAEFAVLRSRVERTGRTAKAGSDQRVSREGLCRLVVAHAAVQTRWASYAEKNMSTCGIGEEIVVQLKSAQAQTNKTLMRLCVGVLSPDELRRHIPGYPGYRWDPPERPIDYKFLPRFSGS
jgi:hypothetical protein